MADNIWRGDQKNVAQVNTITPVAANAATYNVTINGKSVTYTSDASATVAEITAGLVALLQVCDIPEFDEITWTDSTTHVTATAVVPGKPFTQTSSSSAGSLTTATATANKSCNDVNDAANWSAGTVPANGEDVYITDSSVSLLYNLGALSAVTLTSLTIDDTFTGEIGLPTMTDTGYYEYRATELAIGATTQTIGRNDAGGSGRIRINNGSVQTTLNILDTGSPSATGDYAVRWRGTHASNVVNINRGSLGVAVGAGQTAVIATLRIGFVDNQDNDVVLFCSPGVTLTTVSMGGGQVTLSGVLGGACATTINQTGGDLLIYNGTVTTLAIDGGSCDYRSAGTLTTLAVGSEAECTFAHDLRARTVTTGKLYKGGTIRDPFKTVTWTNGLALYRCSLADTTLDLGEHWTLTPSSLAV